MKFNLVKMHEARHQPWDRNGEPLGEPILVPRMYMFLFTPPSQNDNVCILEVSPVGYGSSHFVFPTDADMKRIAKFHCNLRNHEPLFYPGWVSARIDFWEDHSDWKIYETVEAAEKAAGKYWSKIERRYKRQAEEAFWDEVLDERI